MPLNLTRRNGHHYARFILLRLGLPGQRVWNSRQDAAGPVRFLPVHPERVSPGLVLAFLLLRIMRWRTSEFFFEDTSEVAQVVETDHPSNL